MVRTRNQQAIINWRGGAWTELDEACCYEMFFDLCRGRPEISDETTFNDVLIELARRLSHRLWKNFSPLKVKQKIHLLRCQFQSFVQFIEKPGVHFDRATCTLQIHPVYWEHVNVEDNIARYFRTNGFPMYKDCEHTFNTLHAAEIHFDGIPGYSRNLPLEIDSDDSDSEDEEMEDNPAVNAPDEIDMDDVDARSEVDSE
ncbi:hypothetical protein DH2020_021007 [Rehmannia glutinosa]|uniref:Myb/SANT-like domain-containing protein n=1 Tax=Rehmannia glutinosa TaxID=99300 RepID=A0ABR0W9W1_REHGL